MLVLIFSLTQCISILRAQVEKEYKIFISIIVVVQVYLLVYILLISTDIISKANANLFSILHLITNIFVFITYFLIFSFKISKKAKINPYDKTNAHYGAILDDEITRTCLLYHMRDLEEENL